MASSWCASLYPRQRNTETLNKAIADQNINRDIQLPGNSTHELVKFNLPRTNLIMDKLLLFSTSMVKTAWDYFKFSSRVILSSFGTFEVGTSIFESQLEFDFLSLRKRDGCLVGIFI